MILRSIEQDVQISGTKTGSLVSATLRNHTAVREAVGYDIGGDFLFATFLSFVQRKVARRLKAKSKLKKNKDI